MKAQVLCVACLLTGAAAANAQELKWQQSFRGKYKYELLFELEPKKSEDYIRADPNNFHIFIPEGTALSQPVGIVLRKAAYGDFVATLEYEILEMRQPRKGRGAGISFYAMFNTYHRDCVDFGLHRLTDNKLVFNVRQFPVGEPMEGADLSKTPVTKNQQFPASEQNLKGKMRMARKGRKLTLSASEDKSDSFQEVASLDFTSANFRRMRIAADQGGGDSFVMIRLLDFLIEGEKLMPRSKATTTPEPEAEPLAPESTGVSSPVVLGSFLALIVALVIAATVGLWLFQRRRRAKNR